MKSPRRLVGAFGAVAVLCLATAAPAGAASPVSEGPRTLTAAVRGEVIDAPGTDARAEIVTFGADLAPSLLRIAAGESVRIAGWPVAPELRSDVTVTRFEVYAPDARIWKVEGGRQTEVPRSRMAFFLGSSEQDPETRIFLAVDPGTGTFQGLAVSPDGTYDLRSHGKDRYLVSVPEYFLPEDGTGAAEPLSSSCGQEGEVPEFLRESFRGMVDESAVVRGATGEAKLAALHTATIAVDTDNELMLQKFSDDTTAATDYIAALIAAMNVIYERDLNIRLLQGTTFLRVSTVADPWTQTGSGASVAQLVEVAGYWNTNHGAISRALVMMLSGKSSNSFSSSGIAYVPGLCSLSTGYSFTQVFKFAQNTASNDIFVVGHELGHNFGSPHTHCYNPPIDNCFVEGGGCYSGPTSCPASATINGVSARGTIMSYCHVLGGCSAANVFHPTSVDLITNVITPRIGNCVFTAVLPAPTISLVSPASGLTTGGTSVTITGTNFQSGATVTFGGTASPLVSFVSSTQLTATTPARSAGLINVVVTNPDAQGVTATNAFTFLAPAPAVNAVTPNSGLTTGGTAVALNGTNFQSGATVTFDGIPATSVTFVNSTQITAVTPAHATGSVEVVVTNPDTQSGSKDPAFFYSPAPAPTALYTVPPCRLINTRGSNGPLGGPIFAPLAERIFDVTGSCGIPNDAVALVINLTVFDPTALGNLSVYPGNAFYLGTSVLNFQAGIVRANNAIVRLATDGSGTIGIRNGSAGSSHVILDVIGYLLDDPDL
jgi:hypothetical protein